ncbi:DUF445 domain-containing protein, partial [Streptomyces niveus]
MERRDPADPDRAGASGPEPADGAGAGTGEGAGAGAGKSATAITARAAPEPGSGPGTAPGATTPGATVPGSGKRSPFSPLGALGFTAADEEKRRGVRRMKTTATGLLIFVAVIYILATWAENSGITGWPGY